MQVGLNALRIFKARYNLEMQEKYPFIFRKDIDKKCHFDPNKNYLYFPSHLNDSTKLKNMSPWYCFALIPETTVDGKSSLDTSLYLIRFFNWAIYYYQYLENIYNMIPRDPNLAQRSEAMEVIKTFDLAIGIDSAPEQLRKKEKDIFKKSNFSLKPALFLKLCRFFARAWYEENFCSPSSVVGSVEFAYYASNYITGNPDSAYERYNGYNSDAKKEVYKLFGNKSSLTYQFNKFAINAQKSNNSPADSQGNYSYSISIAQLGCKYEFYLYARLRQYRYISPTVQRLHLNPELQSIEMVVVREKKLLAPFSICVGRYEVMKKDNESTLTIYGINTSHPLTSDVASVQIRNRESNVHAEYAKLFEIFSRTYSLSEILSTLEERLGKQFFLSLQWDTKKPKSLERNNLKAQFLF